MRGSNPFGLVAVGNQLFVTDGAQNSLRQVDIRTGTTSTVASFATVPNPLPIGPPSIEAVPTGVAETAGQLLVTLFSGVPFASGTSSVVQVDAASGAATSSFFGDLTTAIGILPLKSHGTTDYLVLETSSEGPFFSGPGVLLRFEGPGVSPSVIADCLELPTSMALDEHTGRYVTQLTGGLVALDIGR